MRPIEIYTFVRMVDGIPYGGQIPASSFEEAQALVPFARVDGKLLEEIPYEEEFTPVMWNGEIH